MGQKFSSNNALHVYVDRPFYHAGDIVSGFVLLNCLSPFQCNRVILKVDGREKVSFREKIVDRRYNDASKQWDESIRYEHHFKSRDFFNIEVQLYSWPQTCIPGQYQFPFSFVLPTGIPGSFSHIMNGEHYYGGMTVQDLSARIKYRLKAECVVPGLLKPNIRHKEYLTVFQSLSRPPTEIKYYKTQEVKRCGCCSQGIATVTAYIQKDCYMAGETACILLEVDNDSEASFDSINVSVRKRLHLDGRTRDIKIDDQVTEQSFPGLPAHTKQVGSDARPLQVNIPLALTPTTSGQLVRCEYSIMIKIKASSIIISNVELKVPVVVYVPSPVYIQYTQPPPFWQPTVVTQPVQLNLPSAPPFPPQQQKMSGYPS